MLIRKLILKIFSVPSFEWWCPVYMWHNEFIFSWNSVEQQRALYCGKTITKVGQGPQYQYISFNFRMNTLLAIALPSH